MNRSRGGVMSTVRSTKGCVVYFGLYVGQKIYSRREIYSEGGKLCQYVCIKGMCWVKSVRR